MKKIIFASFLLVLTSATFAGPYSSGAMNTNGYTPQSSCPANNGCKPITPSCPLSDQIHLSPTQDFDDDEFLYATETEYNTLRASLKKRPAACRSCFNVTANSVYECDNDYCTDNKFIILDAGHVFKGKKIDKTRAYKCSLNANDRWIPNSNDTIECCDVNYKHYKEINGYGGQYRYKALANAFEVCKICSDTKTTVTKATAAKSETVKPAASQPVARTTAENTTTTTTKTAAKPAAESATPADRATTVTTTTTVTSTTPSEISNASDTEPKVGDTCTTNGTASATYKQINGKLKCVATACKPNFYLVVNTNGASQGWCTAKINCGDGKEMKVIDNTKTDRTCIDVTTPTDTDDTISETDSESDEDIIEQTTVLPGNDDDATIKCTPDSTNPECNCPDDKIREVNNTCVDETALYKQAKSELINQYTQLTTKTNQINNSESK